MAEIINLKKLNEALDDLHKYFESKNYHRAEIVTLCSQIILIETTHFSLNAGNIINENLLNQK